MSTKTDDLIVVSRDGTNYKATGAQLFDFEGGATFGDTVESKYYKTAARTAPGNSLFRGYYNPGTGDQETVRITADGSATFAAGNAVISADGNATFAGQVTATEGYALAQLPALP